MAPCKRPSTTVLRPPTADRAMPESTSDIRARRSIRSGLRRPEVGSVRRDLRPACRHLAQTGTWRQLARRQSTQTIPPLWSACELARDLPVQAPKRIASVPRFGSEPDHRATQRQTALSACDRLVRCVRSERADARSSQTDRPTAVRGGRNGRRLDRKRERDVLDHLPNRQDFRSFLLVKSI